MYKSNIMKPINSFTNLIPIIGNDFAITIIKQGQKGDPDWLMDILNEHTQQIPKGSAFYLTGFHDRLNGYPTDNEAIYQDYETNYLTNIITLKPSGDFS